MEKCFWGRFPVVRAFFDFHLKLNRNLKRYLYFPCGLGL